VLTIPTPKIAVLKKEKIAVLAIAVLKLAMLQLIALGSGAEIERKMAMVQIAVLAIVMLQIAVLRKIKDSGERNSAG
jgi:hypothetical protein